ncbi:hypothetical protein [Streptomyces sp. HC307]|uniref:hypothetical protein n=1 Tax=Streptomyces flavusporus TaxID=3385496 RepID=UPI0039176359
MGVAVVAPVAGSCRPGRARPSPARLPARVGSPADAEPEGETLGEGGFASYVDTTPDDETLPYDETPPYDATDPHEPTTTPTPTPTTTPVARHKRSHGVTSVTPSRSQVATIGTINGTSLTSAIDPGISDTAKWS